MVALEPHEDRDQNRGPELLAVIWVFTAIALCTVGLKIYTRIKIIHETGLDDLLIFFSTILILICTILFSVDVHYGMGRHTFWLAEHHAVLAGKINYIANPFGIMAYSIPNIAIAIFVNRILSPEPLQKCAIYALAIAQNIIAAVACVLLFVQCTPTASLWNPKVLPTSCLNAGTLTNYSYFVGAFTAFTDVVLAVVPIMTFRTLRMKPKTKIAVSLLMSFTLVAAICAIVKTSKLDELKDITDFTYASVDLIITAIVEADVIIIAACIPSLRPFVRSVSESVASSYARNLEGRAFGSREPDERPWLQLSSIGQSRGKSSSKASTPQTSQSKEDLNPLPLEHVPHRVVKRTEITSTSEYF